MSDRASDGVSQDDMAHLLRCVILPNMLLSNSNNEWNGGGEAVVELRLGGWVAPHGPRGNSPRVSEGRCRHQRRPMKRWGESNFRTGAEMGFP